MYYKYGITDFSLDGNRNNSIFRYELKEK